MWLSSESTRQSSDHAVNRTKVYAYLKVQSGMLGTREPVTPCLVAQNPPRLPPLEAALGCAWKQASPIISYKILERAPKLVRKMEVSCNNVV